MRYRLTGFAAQLLCASVVIASGSVAAQPPLPEGDAKEAVQAMCVQCHPIARVTGMSMSRDDWNNTVEDMVRMGAQVPRDWVQPIVDYLALNFPAKTHAAEGDQTGPSMRVITLPKQQSALRTIGAGSNGEIWFIEATAGTIGQYRPSDSTVRTYPLPPAVRVADASLVTPAGILWFTLKSSNQVGRLDVAGGAMTLVGMPRPTAVGSTTVDLSGTPYFVEEGSNRIASINPETMQPIEYVLPNPDARPQSLAVTEDHVIWYADRRGYIGRFDTASRIAREWVWPGGTEAPPEGIALGRAEVWSTQCASTCVLLNLNPATSAFTGWPLPIEIQGGARLIATAPNRIVAIPRDGTAIVEIALK